MKVMFRISKLGFGGAEQVFLSIARELQKKHQVQVMFVVDKELGENVVVARNLGFEVTSLNVSRTLMSILPLAKIINKHKPDVVISAYTDTNAACLLSKIISPYKTPVIVSEHSSLHEHWQNKSSLKKKILKFYVGWVYKLANKVLCVSNGLMQQVNALLNQEYKTVMIYNPVRFNSITYKAPKQNNVLNVVAVGRVVPQKDYCTLIKAIADIKKHRAVQLKIVGGTTNSTEFNKVEKMVAEYQLENEVEFVGYSDSVATYYQNSDIFVLSSAWEGFGNVIVEAMAFGLPIVATNCNYGPAEILENGKYGGLVDVGDSEALANAIQEEVNKPLVSAEVLVNRSEAFSETKIANQYYQLICEVIKK
jgi:glycosyltransferase involved in cell wall biosynthesis